MSNIEDQSEWTIVVHTNREKRIHERKLRRARAKEAKRMRKEEQKRVEMLAPKDSKITVVQALPTRKKQNSNQKPSWNLYNEVFPTLNSSPRSGNQNGNLSSSHESASIIKKEHVSKAETPPFPPNLDSSAKLVKKKVGQPLVMEFDPVVKVKQSSLKKLKVTSSKIVKNNFLHKIRNKLDSSAPEKSLRRDIRESNTSIPDETTLGTSQIPNDTTTRDEIVDVNDSKEIPVHQNIPITDRNNSMKSTIHTRKFRDYCDHMLNNELDEYVCKMVQDIIRWQDRAYTENPVKAKANRRYVLGLKETKKLVALSYVKLVIIASNLEPIKSEGGLDDIVTEIKKYAQQRSIPVIFSHTKWKLGYITYRKTPVACIGILNYDGSNENFNKIKNLIPGLKEEYEKKAGISTSNFSKMDDLKENIIPKVDSLNKKMVELLNIRVNEIHTDLFCTFPDTCSGLSTIKRWRNDFDSGSFALEKRTRLGRPREKRTW
ncbi:SECISBP2 [Lepeophtheirus salmonis]|uniref:SECISBP2 n=1 Tax=Lepeophtheirus salmonis TaxID=72036 RepID=A0A7R8HCN3_LEPSM|nr:SECISBP2 [Lepeophtheirus salmonis]CAF3019354.1 SECISBP2 [Lepeophtheirus salmonis]